MLFSKNTKGNTSLQVAILVALLLGFGMMGYYFFYFQPRQVTRVDFGSAPKVDGTKDITKQVQPEQTVRMGVTFRLGNFDMAVAQAKLIGKQIGRNPVYAKTDGQFVSVTFVAKNVGTEASSLSSFRAQVQDGMGRNYEKAENLVWLAAMPLTADFMNETGYIGGMKSSEVKPGFTTEFSIIYEVAADSTNMAVRMGDKEAVVARVTLGF